MLSIRSYPSLGHVFFISYPFAKKKKKDAPGAFFFEKRDCFDKFIEVS